ncbi:T-complex protein 1 subunit alpha [Jatropha curcas]|uniref:T-complex protein 1 subunit alpha n=1 Tax=Jatropha curcas TaxID=180498 RepID=UPI0005FB9F9E|nr:T-complex protein 1 subunit alpha [Jatropha curcas]
MAISAQTLDILGERQSGQDVRTQNVVACQAVANIVKSSLGPVGLDKMLVDDIGDVTITNDGATILKMLEVEHPAAKVLVELAELQDREVGDGTTSVVIVAAELLKRANDLVRNKIHPTSIISGYRLAMREACKYVDEKLAVKVEKLGKDSLVNCAKTSMSSKLIAGDSDFFANLVVDAVQAVKMTNARGEIKYPIKSINILKAHGKSAKDSYLLNGYALNTGRAAQGMPTRVAPARIACLDFNLQKTKMQLGVQVLVTDPRELDRIRQREADMTKERIEKLLKAGANVVLTTKGIDDMALKYFVEAGAIAVRRVRKEDMRHVAKATGATMVSTFADMEGEETFDSSLLGSADEVVEERIADDDVIMIKGTKSTSAVSLILRGANDYMLDEMERALHDALSIVKRTLESNTVVAGGGAVESALSVYLEYLATTLGSREQLAIAEFAESLLIIPKVLAVNAAKDATELVAKLRAYHHTAQTKAEKKHLSSMGLDLSKGIVRNNLEAGVIEPAMSKVKIIQFATEAAITILRIDDMIKLVKDESQNDEE